MPGLSVFPTELGWFGLLGKGRAIQRLTIGHGSAEEVHEALSRWGLRDGGLALCFEGTGEIVERDWFPELRHRLQRYAEGQEFDFRDCEVSFSEATTFQTRVFMAVRKIGYGQTITYGQLAVRAGRPRAARAVGNVMAANPVPIIVPCHRVVAAGGRWGGYSAPQGVTLKRRLLELEGNSDNMGRPLNGFRRPVEQQPLGRV